MKKSKQWIGLAVLGILLFSSGCASPPEVVEPAVLPTQTDIPPAATETQILPTITPIPPTQTPAWEVIASGNVQRLSAAWSFDIPDDGFRSLVISPDGLTLAGGTGENSVSSDQKLRVLDVSTGMLLAESEKLDSIIWDLAYSPTGSYLAVGLDSGIVQLRDPGDLSLIRQFYFPGPVNSLSFSPDGTKLAAGVADNGNGTVYIIDLISGENLLSFWAHPYSVPSMDYSPDGSLLATGAVDRRVNVWNSSTGELIQSLPQDGQGTALAFSHDGGLLASGFCARSESNECREGGVLLWSTTTWGLFRTLSGSGNWIEDLAFSAADDLVAAVDRNGFLFFWKVNDGTILSSFMVSSYGSYSIGISDEGSQLAHGSAYRLGLMNISQ